MDYYFQYLNSRFGEWKIYASTAGIFKLELLKENEELEENPSLITRLAKKELENYFRGSLRRFSVPINFESGTEFQIRIWNELKHVAYGTTTNYLSLAKSIHNPKAVRAVGAANGANPIPIIIPCHRVIGSNGSLVGYGSGLDLKQALLQLEGALPKTLFD